MNHEANSMAAEMIITYHQLPHVDFCDIQWDDWVFDNDSMSVDLISDACSAFGLEYGYPYVDHDSALATSELLNTCNSIGGDTHLGEASSQQVSRSASDLQSPIAATRHDSSMIDIQSQPLHQTYKRKRGQVTHRLQDVALQTRAQNTSSRKKSHITMLASRQLRILSEWLSKHQDNPYPTPDEKDEIATKTELSISQISSWMSRSRKHLHNTKHSQISQHQSRVSVDVGKHQQHFLQPSGQRPVESAMKWKREMKIYMNLHKFFRILAAQEMGTQRSMRSTKYGLSRGRAMSMTERCKPLLAAHIEVRGRAKTSLSHTDQGSASERRAHDGLAASFVANQASNNSVAGQRRTSRPGPNSRAPPGVQNLSHANVSRIGSQKLRTVRWVDSLPAMPTGSAISGQDFDLYWHTNAQQYISVLREQKKYGLQLLYDELEADNLISLRLISLTKQRSQECAIMKLWQHQVFMGGWGPTISQNDLDPKDLPDMERLEEILIDYDYTTSPGSCPTCQSILKLRCMTDFHLVEHDGEKRFVCPCMTCYSSLEDLSQHIKLQHSYWKLTGIDPKVRYLEGFAYVLFQHWFEGRGVTMAFWTLALAWPQLALLEDWRSATRLLLLPPNEPHMDKLCTFDDDKLVDDSVNNDSCGPLLSLDVPYGRLHYSSVASPVASPSSAGSIVSGVNSLVSGSSAANSGASSAASGFSGGSYTNLGPRKGRRLPFTRNRARPHSARPAREKKFFCTFQYCYDRFSSRYAWRRHEESVHAPQHVFVCENGPMDDRQAGDNCLYTSLTSCMQKPIAERTFYRRDTFVQHLRNVHHHGAKQLDLSDWKHSVDDSQYCRQCNFCAITLSQWVDRYSHMVAHFENGDMMRFRLLHYANGVVMRTDSAISPSGDFDIQYSDSEKRKASATYEGETSFFRMVA